MTDTIVAPDPVEAPPAASWWEDLVDIFLSPGEVFARRGNSGWGKPFLLLVAISVILYFLFLPINSLIWEAAMIQNAPPNADLEQMRKGAEMMKYFGVITVPIMMLVMVAATALVLKLASSVLEPAARWGQAFVIATYSAYVVIPQTIAATISVYLASKSRQVAMSDVSFGVLRFVDDPDKLTSAVLGRLDLFPLWGMALTAVGLMVIARMPRGKAFAAALIAWLAIALPSVAIAALTGAK